MSTYSNSKLSTFEQCRLKFKFNYIDMVETEIEESVEAFLGKRVHEALEKLYKDLKFEKLDSLADVLSFYNDEWAKNWNDAIVIVRDEYNRDNYRKMGERFLTDYYKRYTPFDQSRTVGLETQGFVEIGGHNIHVRIDRLAMVDDVYEIHDYKTSNTLPTQDKLDEDRQLAIYAYGVKTMYPDAKRVKLIWHYLAFDKEMQSERTDDELEQLKLDVLKAIKAIETCKDYPPHESALCDWCEFRPICPAFKHLYELEKKDVEAYKADDGVKLVNEYSRLSNEITEKQEAFEEVKANLLEFAKQKGVTAVFGSDVKASIYKYPALSFPKKEDDKRAEFVEMIRKLGLFDQLAMVDVYELAKMLNKGEIQEELAALLEQFIQRGETVKVYLRKT